MRTKVDQLVGELPTAGIAHATRLGLVLKPGLETAVWRGLVTHVIRLVGTSTGARQTLTAWLGDVLAYGETGGRGLISECAAATGINPGTLRNAKMVCTRIPVSCRHDALSWTHHCEVGLAFADPQKIERWLGIAESDGLSAMALRRQIRAHVASLHEQRGASPGETSVTAFQVMRELRASDRMLDHHDAAWREWSPGAAQFALKELRSLTGFVDTLRARALQPTVCPRVPGLNSRLGDSPVDNRLIGNAARLDYPESVLAQSVNAPHHMNSLHPHKSYRPTGDVTSAQFGFVASVFPNLATAVDPTASPATISTMKARHLMTRLARLDLTKAAREATALKDQFRREDQELLRQGRGHEVVARNRELMGIKQGEKTRLVGFGGVRFE